MALDPIAIIDKIALTIASISSPNPVRIHFDDLLGKEKTIKAAHFRNEVSGVVVSTHGYIVRCIGNYQAADNRPALLIEIDAFLGYQAELTAKIFDGIIQKLVTGFHHPAALAITGVSTGGLKFPPRSKGEMDTTDESKLHYAFGQIEIFGNTRG